MEYENSRVKQDQPRERNSERPTYVNRTYEGDSIESRSQTRNQRPNDDEDYESQYCCLARTFCCCIIKKWNADSALWHFEQIYLKLK